MAGVERAKHKPLMTPANAKIWSLRRNLAVVEFDDLYSIVTYVLRLVEQVAVQNNSFCVPKSNYLVNPRSRSKAYEITGTGQGHYAFA